jgi:hypothetical protein
VLINLSIDDDGVTSEYTEWYVVDILGKVLFESLSLSLLCVFCFLFTMNKLRLLFVDEVSEITFWFRWEDLSLEEKALDSVMEWNLISVEFILDIVLKLVLRLFEQSAQPINVWFY